MSTLNLHVVPLIEGPSARGFRIGLYLEHLEEASFLYEQRLSLLYDPELNWPDLRDFEERFEAHIDALVLGEELALAVCRQQAREGDFGELHAAVRVFCRLDRREIVEEIVELLDPEDDERVQAVADALCHELSANWGQSFQERLAVGEPTFTPVAARALGYRRIQATDALIEVLRHAEETAAPDLIWSLGRLRDPRARSLLYNTYLQHESAEMQGAAALALLRIGEPAAIQYCAGNARLQPWALVPIGLGGSKAHLGLLMEIAASDAVSTHCLLALGLLGEVAAVEPLLYHLGDDSLAEQAATAMYLITGAELFEEVFIPEEIDEDELFEDELEEMRTNGERPEEDDEPRGTTITRLSQKLEVWRDWWQQNKTLYKEGVRYRNGRPYGPECLVENLAAERSPRMVRRLAAEELVIRYGCDLPFETDMFVAQQLRSLASFGGWLNNPAHRFEEGKYYLAGRIQSR